MRMIGIVGQSLLLLGMFAAEQCRADVPTAPAEWVDDLRPIAAADWSPERAAHLLRRAGFGATPRDIQQSLALGPRAAVTALVRPAASDDPAIGVLQRTVDPAPHLAHAKAAE